MDLTSALEEQIGIYRRMTGDERVRISLRLHELACEIAPARIRAQRPGASDDEVEDELRRRITLAHGTSSPGHR